MQSNDVYRWWEVEKNNVHKEVFDTSRVLFNNSRDRMDRNLTCLRLYGNMDLTGIGPSSYTQTVAPSLPENRVKMNIVSSMVDTSGARISKMKPKVQFLTSGGDFTSQKQAKQLTKFMLGAFYKNHVHALHQRAFRDAQIFDIGAIKHSIQNGEICSERVLPMELLTDPFDSIYGTPRNLYQYKYVSRSHLAAMPQFKDDHAAIMAARDQLEETIHNDRDIEDFVVVIEAWHLPSGPDADDGRHVIVIGGHTLLDEPYEKSYFPFTFFRWSKPVIGFFGQSLAERLTSLQIEINKMLRIIQRSFHLGSAFKVFLEYGSKVSKEHLNNDIGSIVYYMGKAPTYYVPQTIHPEFFTHLKFLVEQAYAEAGISQTSASSKLPSGIDGASGRAVREYNNIETERFALVSQEFEASFLETAKQYVDLAYDISKDGGNFKVVAQSKTFVEEIEWSKVAPADKNSYIMQMFPTSLLPHEPAGRLAFIQELITSQMIPASFGLELLEFPDLESYLSLKNASVEDFMATLERLIDGEYEAPEPFQDLAEGIKFFQSAYLRARREKVPEQGLDNLRRWIATADVMQQKAQQAQMQAQAQAQPQPAPSSAQS